jgi:hypothetical protein
MIGEGVKAPVRRVMMTCRYTWRFTNDLNAVLKRDYGRWTVDCDN